MKTEEIQLPNLPEKFEIHIADKQMNWQEAMDYTTSIGMRLPTKLELQAIAETKKFEGWYWSASTQSINTGDAWIVYLDDGDTYNINKTSSISVLCVVAP